MVQSKFKLHVQLLTSLFATALSLPADQDRVSDFEVKLMDIDSEHLGIPDTDYAATIHMPASEYQRICRDLSSIGDTGAHSTFCALGHHSEGPVFHGVLLGCRPVVPCCAVPCWLEHRLQSAS